MSNLVFTVTAVLGLVAFADADELPEAYRSLSPAEWRSELTEGDTDVQRRRAAYVLGRLPSEQEKAAQALAKAFDDDDLVVRWYAADSLGRLGGRAKPALDALLTAYAAEDADLELRRNIARALGRIGQSEARIQTLLKTAMSNEEEPLVMAAAAESLASLDRDDMAYAKLVELASRADPIVAYEALRGVERLLVQRVPPSSLSKQLRHADADVRRRTVRVFGLQGWPAAPTILEQQASGTQPIVILESLRLVARTSPAGEQAPLARQAADYSWSQIASGGRKERDAANSLLVALGPTAIESLWDRWSDYDAPARKRMLEAFSDWLKPIAPKIKSEHEAWRAAANPWVESLLEATAAKDAETRKLSLWLLAELPLELDEGKTSKIRDALRDPDVFNRRNAARILRSRPRQDDAPP